MRISSLGSFTRLMCAACLVAGVQKANAGEDDGDGAPHIAIADTGTALEVEFEIDFGLDQSGSVPVITLDASVFDSFFGGYRTFPINDTPSPNDDLGFVSEVEGAGEEGGVINGDIVVRLLSSSDNFGARLGSTDLFTDTDIDFELGTSFDTHPIWFAFNPEGDFTSATASFEIFDVSTGSIGSGAGSLGQFDLIVAVPEPTTAGLLAAASLMVIRRRRA